MRHICIDTLFQVLWLLQSRGFCVRCGVHDHIIAYVPRHLFSSTSVLTFPFWEDYLMLFTACWAQGKSQNDSKSAPDRRWCYVSTFRVPVHPASTRRIDWKGYPSRWPSRWVKDIFCSLRARNLLKFNAFHLPPLEEPLMLSPTHNAHCHGSKFKLPRSQLMDPNW